MAKAWADQKEKAEKDTAEAILKKRTERERKEAEKRREQSFYENEWEFS